MILQAVVTRLMRYGDKDANGESLRKACLIENYGMEGDCRAKSGERQISLMPLEEKLWIEKQTEQGLCFPRFRENILFEGSSFFLSPGTRLRIGDAVIEISNECKQCFDECLFFSRGETCSLAGKYLFAKVIEGGIIRSGDRIERESLL